MHIYMNKISIYLSIYLSIYIYIYIYTYIYIHIMFNAMLKIFGSRYKVSFMWDSNQRPSNICSDALPTDLVSLIQR